MKTKLWAILLIFICTLFAAVAQIFWKLGSNNLGVELYTALVWVFFGFVIYAIAAVIMIIALKHGELSVLYPIIALSFIWVNLMSWFVFGEPLNVLKWSGIVFIILGVSFIGKGSKK